MIRPLVAMGALVVLAVVAEAATTYKDDYKKDDHYKMDSYKDDHYKQDSYEKDDHYKQDSYKKHDYKHETYGDDKYDDDYEHETWEQEVRPRLQEEARHLRQVLQARTEVRDGIRGAFLREARRRVQL